MTDSRMEAEFAELANRLEVVEMKLNLIIEALGEKEKMIVEEKFHLWRKSKFKEAREESSYRERWFRDYRTSYIY
jgi:hypothetical protein